MLSYSKIIVAVFTEDISSLNEKGLNAKKKIKFFRNLNIRFIWKIFNSLKLSIRKRNRKYPRDFKYIFFFSRFYSVHPYFITAFL